MIRMRCHTTTIMLLMLSILAMHTQIHTGALNPSPGGMPSGQRSSSLIIHASFISNSGRAITDQANLAAARPCEAFQDLSTNQAESLLLDFKDMLGFFHKESFHCKDDGDGSRNHHDAHSQQSNADAAGLTMLRSLKVGRKIHDTGQIPGCAADNQNFFEHHMKGKKGVVTMTDLGDWKGSKRFRAGHGGSFEEALRAPASQKYAETGTLSMYCLRNRGDCTRKLSSSFALSHGPCRASMSLRGGMCGESGRQMLESSTTSPRMTRTDVRWGDGADDEQKRARANEKLRLERIREQEKLEENRRLKNEKAAEEIQQARNEEEKGVQEHFRRMRMNAEKKLEREERKTFDEEDFDRYC
jgi:hypothetical protein